MIDGLISIIIPAYNAERSIEKTLRSIVIQTYSNLEILVVDDGSSDKTAEVVLRLAEKDNRICLIQKTNGGVSSARNFGLARANGEYIMFIDADDFIDTYMCATMVETITTYNVQLASCGAVAETNEGKQLYTVTTEETRFFDCESCVISVLRNGGISGSLWNKIFLNSVIKNNDIRFSEEITNGEDLLFVCMYIARIRIAYHTKVGEYHYIISSNSLSHVNAVKNEFSYKRLSEEKAYEEISRLFSDNSAIICQLNKNYTYLYRTLLKEVYVSKRPDRKIGRDLQHKLLKKLGVIIGDKSTGMKEKMMFISLATFPRFVGVILRWKSL